MSKIIRTEKPSVLPFYAAAAAGLVLWMWIRCSPKSSRNWMPSTH